MERAIKVQRRGVQVQKNIPGSLLPYKSCIVSHDHATISRGVPLTSHERNPHCGSCFVYLRVKLFEGGDNRGYHRLSHATYPGLCRQNVSCLSIDSEVVLFLHVHATSCSACEEHLTLFLLGYLFLAAFAVHGSAARAFVVWWGSCTGPPPLRVEIA